MTDTRREPRLKVLLRARYREPTEDQPVLAECRDLSPSGMFVMTLQPSSPGALIRFGCTSDAPDDDFSGIGRVVWNRGANDASGPPGMGVRFVKLDQGGREAIARLVQRVRGASAPPLRSREIPAEASRPRAPSRAPFAQGRMHTLQGIGVDLDGGAQRTPSDAPSLAGSPYKTFPMGSMPAPAPTSAAPKTISSAPPSAPTRTISSVPPKSNAAPSVRGSNKPALPRGDASRGRVSDRPPAPGVTDDLRVRPRRFDGEDEAPTRRAREAPSAGPPRGEAPAPAALPPSQAVEQRPAPALPAPAEQTRRSPSVRWLLLAVLVLLAVLIVVVMREPGRGTVQPAARSVPAPNRAAPEEPARQTMAPAAVPEPPRQAPVVSKAPATAAQPRAEAPKGVAVVRQALAVRSRLTRSESQRAPTERPAPLHRDSAAPPAPAPSEAPATAEATQTSENAEPPQVERPAQPKPLQRALECLSRGDNACVIQALENKASSADEIELLVATYRSLGDVSKATREMRRYLERFPTGRRAGEYDLVLRRQSSQPAPEANGSPGSTP